MVSLALLAGTGLTIALLPAAHAEGPAASLPSAVSTAPATNAPAAAPKPLAPTIAQALKAGVLIVISKPSQRMHVFKDGAPWLVSPVSTGRRGHATPAGVFPVLEKQRFHRSNLYSNAPMPFMQRLTFGGIAIHAGYLPGYPASHGCIRVPMGVARSLFGLTRAGDTTVVIMNAAMQSDDQARRLALGVQQPGDGPTAPVRLAYAPVAVPGNAAPASAAPAPLASGSGQTIQLAAALSPQEAEARWSWLLGLQSRLGRLDKTVVPVAMGSHRFFRLRASGPGAYDTCSQLRGAGIDCFRVL